MRKQEYPDEQEIGKESNRKGFPVHSALQDIYVKILVSSSPIRDWPTTYMYVEKTQEEQKFFHPTSGKIVYMYSSVLCV